MADRARGSRPSNLIHTVNGESQAGEKEALSYLRKEGLDVYNRLHSIATDVDFVCKVHDFYGTSLPLLPNLRCGAFYVDPANIVCHPTYFKSTDGHFGNWSFNLRRPNLHILPSISIYNGIVLVDSTRAGKRLPDALSKTVPIWCAVVNRALLLRFPDDIGSCTWDVNLYTPPSSVSIQEHAQIENRLDGWAVSLAKSSYDLLRLARPLRPLWITPSNSAFPKAGQDFLPVICVSASEQVTEGMERRLGFSYVQGSGDDHELWGMGLTPELFWAHRERLLAADRKTLPGLISSLLSSAPSRPECLYWMSPPSPIVKVNGRLLLTSISDLPQPLPIHLPMTEQDGDPIVYVIVESSPDPLPLSSPSPNVLRLHSSRGKKGQLLSHILPPSIAFIRSKLFADDRIRVCIACDDGRDLSVGVALVALMLLFDDQGRLSAEAASIMLTKVMIRSRLEWIIASRPQANPSRATLKRVNKFLLSPSSFRSSDSSSTAECHTS